MTVTGEPATRRRILIVGINYRPEMTGIGPYTAGLAEALVSRGDDVTVLTGLPHYPAWRIARQSPRSLLRRENIQGVTIFRAAHYVPRKQSAIRRALYEGTFGLTGLLAYKRISRPDAILGIVPSLSGAVLARLIGQRLGAPYGLLFQDLMGPSASQSGMVGGSAVAGVTTRAEAWVSRPAKAIGVVAEAFTPYLVSLGVSPRRISHVQNWTRPTSPTMTVPETRARFGWLDGEQIVLHAGNIGLKQGLEQVVEAARIAANRHEPIRFVLSGGGNQAAAIQTAARGLPNVDFLGVQSDGTHASLLASADVLLLSERATQIDMSLPSKLTAYFAAGRPVVAAVPLGGGSAREVRRSGAGFVVPAGEPERLFEAFERLRTDPMLAAELGVAGPAHARANTSAALCIARAMDFVDTIVA